MPTIKDLTPGVIYEGNEGDRWIVGDGINSENEITVVLKKLKIEEKLEVVDPVEYKPIPEND